MKKLFLWAVTVLLTGCCVFNGVRHPGDRQSLAERLEDETVALVYYDDEEDVLRPYCSGVWVEKDTFLTAFHCVSNLGNEAKLNRWSPLGQVAEYSLKSDIEAGDAPAFSHRATVAVIDVRNDLALLRIDTTDLPKKQRMHPIADVSHDSIHDGDTVHAVGHSLGHWWTYMQGWVSSSERFDESHKLMNKDFKTLQANVMITYGNSGGGLFDNDGRLIGLCSLLYPRWPGLAFYIHRDTVAEFLEAQRIHN
jgi:S1-C subfamily serine protease